MKRVITASKGSVQDLLNAFQAKLDLLESSIEVDTVESAVDLDDETDAAAVEYLVDNTPLDRDAAEFLVEWEFAGDPLKTAKDLTYYIQWDDEDTFYNETLPSYEADGIEITYWDDAAFDGVIWLLG